MDAIVAVLDKEKANATKKAVAMLEILQHETVEAFGIASASTLRLENSIDALEKVNIHGHAVVGQIFSKRGQKKSPMRLLKNAALAFNGTNYSDEILWDKDTQKKRKQLAQKLTRKTEGDFAFAIAETERLITGRHVMGTRPLYYGEDTNTLALASERKALWKIRIEKTKSFPPGYVGIADQQGFRFTETKKLSYSAPKPITMQAAARQLQALLKKSTQKKVSGLKEVAVAFSGGLDSSIIATLTKNTDVAITLIHASLAGQPETQHAKQIAEELKLPIETCEFNENDVEKVLPDVLWAIEESDPVDISIGIPVYWTAEKASERGFSMLLAGQGADELFGGYKRYVNSYLTHGAEKTRKQMFDDVVKLYETNIERDYKICSRHNVDLRLPFATYAIAKFAENLPINLKLEPKATTLRKLVLRRVAENLGLPMSVVTKPKKAIQYTTGVSKALKKIAKKHHLTIKDYLENMFQATCKKMMPDD